MGRAGGGDQSLVIDPCFRGPPDSANGGYVCGLLARLIDGPAEVTLRVPPPLSQPLQVERRGEQVVLLDDDTVIADAKPSIMDLELTEPVGLDEARLAAAGYPWRDRHPYPTCFVCGPDRPEGDGLGIFPGPVAGRSLYAAPWSPDRSFVGADDKLLPEVVWAALDCPSGIVTDLFGGVGLILLGRLTAEIHRRPSAGGEYVVQAWTIERDGRKLSTGSALFSADGELCAAARAVWIEVRERDRER